MQFSPHRRLWFLCLFVRNSVFFIHPTGSNLREKQKSNRIENYHDQSGRPSYPPNYPWMNHQQATSEQQQMPDERKVAS